MMSVYPILEWISHCRLITGYYHLVNDHPPAHIMNLYPCKSKAQFEQDLDFLLKRYKPIDLPQLLNYGRAGEPLPGRFLLLTFDDGFREAYDVIAPLLRRKGVPAVFFINTAFIDNRDMSYEHKKSIIIQRLESCSAEQVFIVTDILKKAKLLNSGLLQSLKRLTYAARSIIGEIGTALEIDFKTYLQEQRPYLTQEQIGGLISAGFYIGSHSIDHPLYKDIPLEEQLRQTIQSTEHLRSLFGLRYGLFAFPHTDAGVPSLFFKTLMQTKVIDMTFGTSGLLDDSVATHIQRTSFERPLKPVRNLLRKALARRFYYQVRRSGTIFHPAL
jgi:peptidoglycan/xylan/chitin deacetylase (PgdA/CDA1 family)